MQFFPLSMIYKYILGISLYAPSCVTPVTSIVFFFFSRFQNVVPGFLA